MEETVDEVFDYFCLFIHKWPFDILKDKRKKKLPLSTILVNVLILLVLSRSTETNTMGYLHHHNRSSQFLVA